MEQCEWYGADGRSERRGFSVNSYILALKSMGIFSENEVKNESSTLNTDEFLTYLYSAQNQVKKDKRNDLEEKYNDILQEPLTAEIAAYILTNEFEETSGFSISDTASNLASAAEDINFVSQKYKIAAYKGIMMGFFNRAALKNGKYYIIPQRVLTLREAAELLYNFIQDCKTVTAASGNK